MSYSRTQRSNRVVSLCTIVEIFSFLLSSPSGPRPPLWSSSTTLRHTTLGRTPLEEWTARRTLYLTTHNNHNRQTALPPKGFASALTESERPLTHALNRADTAIGHFVGMWVALCTVVNHTCTNRVMYTLITWRDSRHWLIFSYNFCDCPPFSTSNRKQKIYLREALTALRDFRILPLSRLGLRSSGI
jgi:hypothetical protein